jgi:predicted transcriptional regulator
MPQSNILKFFIDNNINSIKKAIRSKDVSTAVGQAISSTTKCISKLVNQNLLEKITFQNKGRYCLYYLK